MAGVLTDDGTVWPEDQPAQTPPGPPQPGLWTRMTTPAPGQTWSPISIPGILGGMWSGAKDAAAIPEDMRTGKLDMSDPSNPSTAGRFANAALTMMGLGGLFAPSGEAILSAGARRTTAAPVAAAPKILSNSVPTSEDVARILGRGAELRKGAWPQMPANESMFDTSPEGYARTTSVAPQRSLQDIMPAPAAGQALPLDQRVAPIVEASPEISSAIADRLYPWVRDQDPRLGFYNTGGIYETLTKLGIDPATIVPEWAGQVAATSPRTETPSNLRNASYLLYRRGPGQTPMTEAEFDATGNPEGYGLMKKQIGSALRFGDNTQNPLTAPKQFTFHQNVQGNLASPTIDTHNIRGSIYQWDQMNPGQLNPRNWFTSDAAYQTYRAHGFPSGTDGPPRPASISPIRPTRARSRRARSTTASRGAPAGGVKRQIEFGPMTDARGTTPRACSGSRTSPSVQAGKWFSYGQNTGLRSPVRSLTQLFGDQVYDTARTIGVPAERVLEWWARKLIPLTQNEPQPGPAQTQIG